MCEKQKEAQKIEKKIKRPGKRKTESNRKDKDKGIGINKENL